MAQDLFVVVGHDFFGNAGDFGDGLLDFAAADFAAAAFRLHDALGGAGFVDNVDGFVGQKAIRKFWSAGLMCSSYSAKWLSVAWPVMTTGPVTSVTVMSDESPGLAMCATGSSASARSMTAYFLLV